VSDGQTFRIPDAPRSVIVPRRILDELAAQPPGVAAQFLEALEAIATQPAVLPAAPPEPLRYVGHPWEEWAREHGVEIDGNAERAAGPAAEEG
jgi:hypothetical protein